MSDGRIAFVVNAPEMVHHYGAIWEHLPAGAFSIVAAAEGVREAVASQAASWSGACVELEDVLASGDVFARTVTHYDLEAMEGVPLGRLAPAHTRMMYSYGKVRWNTSSWNRRYDSFLVFGPVQSAMLRAFAGRKFEVGYPRFDRVLRRAIDEPALRARWGLPAEGPIVAWLPTWRAASSIDAFADAIAALQGACTVVVKPHPATIRKEPARLARLRAAGLRHLVLDGDSAELQALASLTLCDYGGPAFGAIYCDRALLLLDVPGAAGCWTLGDASFELQLRRVLPHVGPGHLGQLSELVVEGGAARAQGEARQRLRHLFFGEIDGNAGARAAAVLQRLVAETHEEAAA